MNLKFILGCLLAVSVAASSDACLNKAGTKFEGGSGDVKSYFGWARLKNSIERRLAEDGVKMEAKLRGSTKFEDRNDYAIALMYLGRAAESVELLKQLEQERPGQFYVAANLGTAYELAGNNTEALKWINEGIRRNPADHDGTEWLHAKILEAKLAHEKDAHYFEKHSVLELQPGQISDAKLTLSGKTMTPQELAKAIEYQLGERLQFVKKPDPSVASLLFDYAAIEAATKSMESAKHILKMATDYGYPKDRVEALNKEFDRRLAWAAFKRYSLYVVIGLAVIALLYFLYRRGIFVLSRKDLKPAKPA